MRRWMVAVLLLPLMAQAPAPSTPAPGSPAPGMSAPDAWLPRGSAEVILLDKLRGQPTPMSIKMGQSVSFGTLTITLRNCATRPPDLPQNSAAFLEVVDGKNGGSLFRGWVLSNTPAVGQLESPIYDLRLVACR